MKKPEKDKPFNLGVSALLVLALTMGISTILAVSDFYIMVGDVRLSSADAAILITFAFVVIFLFGLAIIFLGMIGKFFYKQFEKTPIPALKTMSRIALFLALGFATYYSAEYNPILILPITALIIGYALILIFARESGNVEG